MFFALTGAVKNRMIQEIRRYFSYHPKYPDLPDHIQGKYSYKERPQQGIIVKTSGANRVDLSSDNYIGIVRSHCYLAKVKGFNGLAIEWVREDAIAIQNNSGRFPATPGVYYIELVEDNQFKVYPFLDILNEIPAKLSSLEYQLSNTYTQNTLRVYAMPAGYALEETTNYIADPTTGAITLTKPLGNGEYLSADYRNAQEPTGPWVIHENFANHQAIPGVVMAFGRRCQKGDRIAIVVTEHREETALEYGGRWDVQVELDIMARDVYAQQDIADQLVIYLWGILRSRLSAEGLELTDTSMSGESEEMADETGDDYYYNSTISVTVQTEWKVWIPLVLTFRQMVPLTAEQAALIAGMTDEDVAKMQTGIQTFDALGLEPYRDPFFIGKSHNFETIG